MRATPSCLVIVAGVVAALGSVAACDDDVPGLPDALSEPPRIDARPAACDCPRAEPPLAGRFVVVSATQVIAPNDTGAQSVGCPAGAQLVSGSCTTAALNPGRDVTLQQSGFYDDARGWRCAFRNNEPAPVAIKVSAICLAPAP